MGCDLGIMRTLLQIVTFMRSHFIPESETQKKIHSWRLSCPSFQMLGSVYIGKNTNQKKAHLSSLYRFGIKCKTIILAQKKKVTYRWWKCLIRFEGNMGRRSRLHFPSSISYPKCCYHWRSWAWIIWSMVYHVHLMQCYFFFYFLEVYFSFEQ